MRSLRRLLLCAALLVPIQAWADAFSSTAPFSPQSSVTPTGGTLASTLATLLGRIVSIDDSSSVVHDGVADDTQAIQAVLNAVAATGGTVLAGPHQYAVGSSAISGLQPVSAQFNGSGFTLSVPSAPSFYTAGNSYTLTGFAAPFTQLNGTWTAASVSSGAVVVLTSLTGSQTSTSTGLGVVTPNLTIPSGVKLVCPQSMVGAPPASGVYSSLPYTFVVGANSTVVPQSNGGFSGCSIISSAAAGYNSTTSSLRQELTMAAAFTGTGVSALVSDIELSDLFIAGFSTGINANSAARLRITHANIDANNCVATNASHDISHYYDIHCQSYLTAPNVNAKASYAVTGVADAGDGSHHWRVSTTGATNFIVGDTAFVSGVVGAGSVNGTQTVAAVGSGFIDLTGGFAVAQSVTGNTVSQSYCILVLSGTSGIGLGDAITGTGIPASTTVTDVIPAQNALCMSAQATATATSVAITTTPQAYSSGGTVVLDSFRRNGTGFSWTNGETNSCVDCFSINQQRGFYIGPGASWTSLTNTKADGYCPDGATDTVGYQIDGSAVGTFIQGGSTQCNWVVLRLTGTNTNQAHIIQGMVLNGASNGRMIEAVSGRYIISGNSNGQGSSKSFITSGVGFFGYNSNDLKPLWEFDNAAALTKIDVIGNSYSNSTTYQGSFNLYGNVNIGGGGVHCNQFSNCGANITGPVADLSASSGVYGAYTVPGNNGSWLFTGASTVATYNTALPTPSNGVRLQLAYQQAVTTSTATSTSGSVAAFPTTIAAGQLVICQAWSTTWYCR